jgi:hypothetical protein
MDVVAREIKQEIFKDPNWKETNKIIFIHNIVCRKYTILYIVHRKYIILYIEKF